MLRFAVFRLCFCVVILCCILFSFVSHSSILDSPKYSALVVDTLSGSIIYQHQPKKRRYPASLIKVMTIYMIFDAIEKKQLEFDQVLKVSTLAASRPALKLGMKAGDEITVREAILALIVRSANDVATVVAEHIGGSEENFVRMMNKKAREIGMSHTNFQNASGWHHPNQYTNALDMVKMAIAIKADFPQHYHFFQNTQFRYNGRVIRGHNRVTRDYERANGMKTGYFGVSGFNIITTASSDEGELVAVVFGGPTYQVRDAHIKCLLDKGYEYLKSKVIAFERGEDKYKSIKDADDVNYTNAFDMALYMEDGSLQKQQNPFIVLAK